MPWRRRGDAVATLCRAMRGTGEPKDPARDRADTSAADPAAGLVGGFESTDNEPVISSTDGARLANGVGRTSPCALSVRVSSVVAQFGGDCPGSSPTIR